MLLADTVVISIQRGGVGVGVHWSIICNASTHFGLSSHTLKRKSFFSPGSDECVHDELGRSFQAVMHASMVVISGSDECICIRASMILCIHYESLPTKKKSVRAHEQSRT